MGNDCSVNSERKGVECWRKLRRGGGVYMERKEEKRHPRVSLKEEGFISSKILSN